MHRSAALVAVLLLAADAVVSQTFDANDAIAAGQFGPGNAAPGAENTAAAQVADAGDSVNAELAEADADEPETVLEQPRLRPVTTVPRICECMNADNVKTDDIRAISDEFASDGNKANSYGMTNMVWAFGQFVDHDLVLSLEDTDGPTFDVKTSDGPMALHRAITTFRSGCEAPLNVHTPQLDNGNIYSTDKNYLENVLRLPGTCFLRVSEGDFLPLTTFAGDDGRFHFLAGDARVAEHAFLTATHTVWLREHNRMCQAVEDDASFSGMSADAKFSLVKKIVTGKYQQIILKEFLPALGISETDVKRAKRKMNRPDVSVEFSIAYRLGHDLIPNKVGKWDIADTFNSEAFYLTESGSASKPSRTFRDDAESRMTSVISALVSTQSNEIDGKLSDALRNFLFGREMGEDLAGRNIFRGRDAGLPTYAGLAECMGFEPDATVEQETPDAWLGLLREPTSSGSPLGPTLRAIIVEQFHRSFFGPGGLYWKRYRSELGKFVSQIESTKYSDILSANTGVSVSGNVFKK